MFNTLGRRIEGFVPYEPHTVKMYVCGPTVYDEVHIGHGRTFVSFDAISRYLRTKGYNVIRVQNITDIDDKIINKAKEIGKPWNEVSEHYSRSYLELLNSLKVKVDIHPKVTTHIKEIIDFVQKLIEKGNAYVANGSVYFDVNTYEKYGQLSNVKKEEWDQGEEIVKEKKNTLMTSLFGKPIRKGSLLGVTLGKRKAWLAYRVLNYVHKVSRRSDRHSRRRDGLSFPTPRERESSDRGINGAHVGEVLDARCFSND